MKTGKIDNIPAFEINNVEDVRTFFKWCVENSIMIHPDDDFEWVVDFAEKEGEKPCINREQAQQLNALMERCFEVCPDDEENGIYALAGWEKMQASMRA